MATTTVAARMAKAIREAYPLPPELDRLHGLATFDLWHGPLPVDGGDEGEPWPGFATACERLRAWAVEHLPGEVWYDDDSGNVSDTKPEPWKDDTYHVPRPAILAAVFPLKLAEYL